jgi:hypothetical protein
MKLTSAQRKQLADLAEQVKAAARAAFDRQAILAEALRNTLADVFGGNTAPMIEWLESENVMKRRHFFRLLKCLDIMENISRVSPVALGKECSRVSPTALADLVPGFSHLEILGRIRKGPNQRDPVDHQGIAKFLAAHSTDLPHWDRDELTEAVEAFCGRSSRPATLRLRLPEPEQLELLLGDAQAVRRLDHQRTWRVAESLVELSIKGWHDREDVESISRARTSLLRAAKDLEEYLNSRSKK